MSLNIRQIKNNNEIWYVAKDICNILLVKDTSMALNIIPDKWKKKEKILTNGGKQNMLIIQINAVKKLLQCSRSINKDKIIKSLNIDLNIIYDCKESSHLKIISASFKCFSQFFQHQIDIYRVDLCFPEYKLIIEVDENNHKDRCEIYEQKRQNFIENLGYKFIRFNPDEENFNIGNIISLILSETKILFKKDANNI